ncbi:MAG TPA: hypothetical protein VKW76_12585 [Candidatus Binatia bacterium]|nr:hypothetical protein [Candidatus Binatia bacterium]
MKGWRMGMAAAGLLGVLAAATPARADSAGSWEDAGWGTLAVLSNVVYMPAKVVYATLGGLTGGLAFACTGGDLQTAENVWVPSLGGTYVITPRMLRGEDDIQFAGSSAPAAADGAASAPSGLQEQQLGSR